MNRCHRIFGKAEKDIGEGRTWLFSHNRNKMLRRKTATEKFDSCLV
jgi:hypothetical protein